MSINPIQEYENSLRDLICLIMKKTYSNNWIEKLGVTNNRIELWQDKLDEEKKKFRDKISDDRILYYSDFYDLKKIITRNWVLFLPILKNKKRFEIFYSEIEKFRNSIAHGRVINKHDINLIDGICNDLKTQIVMFHNNNLSPDDYFIKILKVSDNYGNIWNHLERENQDIRAKTILRTGDKLIFQIDAFEPKDKQLIYWINISGYSKTKKQSENEIEILINENITGRLVVFNIMVATIDNEMNFETVKFKYTILPKD